MAVYVDNARMRYKNHWLMSHMVADTLEELHHMAYLIGLRRSWFQKDASTPHYDITQSKRAAALRHGAVPVTRRELAKLLPQIRARL